MRDQMIFNNVLDLGSDDLKFSGKERLLQLIQKHSRFVPGFSLGIIDQDVIYVYCTGKKSVNDEEHVSPFTLYSISSLTKVMTALLVMKLVDEKKIELDGKVYDYLPSFTFKQHTRGHAITLRNLLMHTSGLAGVFPSFYIDSKVSLMEHVYAELSNVAIVTQSEHVFNYSSANYNLLGYICETVTGTLFDKLMEEFLRSLGMNGTTFDFQEAYNRNDIAYGHIASYRDFQIAPYIKNNPGFYPSTQMFSNISDLARMTFLLLNRGSDGNVSHISDALIDAMMVPRVPIYTDRGDYFGLGLCFKGGEGERVIHEGIGLGYYSRMILQPERNVGMVMLANSQLYGFTSKITHFILDEVLVNRKSLFIMPKQSLRSNIPDLNMIRFGTYYHATDGHPSAIEPFLIKDKIVFNYYDLSIENGTQQVEISKIENGGTYCVLLDSQLKKVGFFLGSDGIQVEQIIIGNTPYSEMARTYPKRVGKKYVGVYLGCFESSRVEEQVKVTLNEDGEIVFVASHLTTNLVPFPGQEDCFCSHAGYIEFIYQDQQVSGFRLQHLNLFRKAI